MTPLASSRVLRIAAAAAVAAVLLIAFDVPARAQGGGLRVALVAPGDGYSAPPSGPLNAVLGKKLQPLPAGVPLEVLEQRRYGGFEGTNVWLKVVPPQGGGAPVWVDGGVQQRGQIVPSGVVARN